MATDSSGQDPNATYDEARARGEDPRNADLSEGANKEHQAEPVPFKITNQGNE